MATGIAARSIREAILPPAKKKVFAEVYPIAVNAAIARKTMIERVIFMVIAIYCLIAASHSGFLRAGMAFILIAGRGVFFRKVRW